ncbi:B- and T-lymphocyte attenuator-like isoform X2 [Tachysurus fulvidraco]|uniref:B- and T-lymphocyte attenuator-like isoform X2 n=2 Tax=Tachysurus fulvidraco TaxID=1234273 RepID=UPI001FEF8EE8|nr:B- and T-lymphocyte attenuator-like isoform X2 [Tachysurus fulvidraco]
MRTDETRTNVQRFFMARCVFHIIWILIIHLWLSLLITGTTEDCFPAIRVPRNTVWKAREMDNLRINCTVESESNCWNKIYVTWCKIDLKNECIHLNHSNHTTTEWKHINESPRLFFLIFQNVSMQDAGLYRCMIISPAPSISHNINVTVTEYVPDSSTASQVTQGTTINANTNTTAHPTWPQSYVYICSGVGVLVFIVVVSVIFICCRGKKKSVKKTIHQNQCTPSPVADHAPPVYPREFPQKSQTLPAQVSLSASCTYDTPPARVRVSSLRDRPSAGRHPVSQGLRRQCHNRLEVEDLEEVAEENPLIYASLNHGAVPQRPVRVAHVQIEASEYAAIKLT